MSQWTTCAYCSTPAGGVAPCCPDCRNDRHAHCPSWPTCTRADYQRDCAAQQQNDDGSWSPAQPIGWQEEHGPVARFVFWLRGVEHCNDREGQRRRRRDPSQTSTPVDVPPEERAPEVSAPLLPTHNAPSSSSSDGGAA